MNFVQDVLLLPMHINIWSEAKMGKNIAFLVFWPRKKLLNNSENTRVSLELECPCQELYNKKYGEETQTEND